MILEVVKGVVHRKSLSVGREGRKWCNFISISKIKIIRKYILEKNKKKPSWLEIVPLSLEHKSVINACLKMQDALGSLVQRPQKFLAFHWQEELWFQIAISIRTIQMRFNLDNFYLLTTLQSEIYCLSYRFWRFTSWVPRGKKKKSDFNLAGHSWKSQSVPSKEKEDLWVIAPVQFVVISAMCWFLFFPYLADLLKITKLIRY